MAGGRNSASESQREARALLQKVCTEVYGGQEEESNESFEVHVKLEAALGQAAQQQVQQEVMLSRCPWFPKQCFSSKSEQDELRRTYNDGRRIYVNRLIFYPVSSYKPNMISLG